VWFYDSINEYLIVEPKFSATLPTGEKIEGFYKAFINENLNPIFDCVNSATDFLTATEYKKNVVQLFKHDSKDSSIEEDDRLYANTEILSDKFEEGETEIENRAIAPTANDALPTPYGKDDGANGLPIVPFMISYNLEADNPTKSVKYEYELRELAKVGIKAGDWFWYQDANELNQYLQLAQVSTAENINGGYATKNGIAGNTKTFFAKDFELYEHSVIQKLTAIIQKCDVENLQDLFRLMMWVQIKNESTGRNIVESVQIDLNSDKAEFTLIAVDY
jgi:hypothetical protein